jgi:SNF2 family DNA or RNA helicase
LDASKLAGGRTLSGIIYAEKVGESIELNAGYTDKELTRAIPGSRFHSPPPVWTVPLSWAACRQLRGTFNARLRVGPELIEWAQTELTERINKALALREAYEGAEIPLKPPAGLKLRPFQQCDVAWMLAAESGLLMNPVGAGKTPVACTWMRNKTLERALVICPAQMRLVWVEEMSKWYPELEAIPIIGTAGERRKLIQEVADYGGLAIVGLEAARLHSRLAPYGQVKLTEAEKQPKDLNLINWQAVLVDEAHRLADPKSKQTRASWAIGVGATHRWGITATPQTKGLDTLWAVLHFTDPVEWPSRTKFIDRYATTVTNFWGGMTVGALKPEMEQEFQSIFDPRSRRLPKAIVLPQLPPVVRIVKELEMTPEQREAYRQMSELSIAQVKEQDVVVATSTAAQYTRLGQFASSFARVEERLVNVRDKETGEVEQKMKQFVELELPSNKIAAFLSDLEDWRAQEEAVCVWASSRRLIVLLSEILTKKKIKHALIVGGQKDIERFEEIKRFQEGEVDVILGVIKAGGTGITLSRARIGAVLQRSWSNVEDQQMEGRWNRIGSEIHSSTMRVDYLSKETVDIGQFYDVLPGKEDMLQKVLRDKETIERMMRGSRP